MRSANCAVSNWTSCPRSCGCVSRAVRVTYAAAVKAGGGRPAPERPIDGGMATEALIVHVVVSKFCDALPLYRQSQMLARQGVTLDRSTLSNWVGRACWWLTPLYDLLVGTALSSTKLFADDTTLPVLDPGRGRTKNGRLGVTRSTTGRGAAKPTRWPPMSIPRTARARAPPGTWPASAACFRLTAITASSGWPGSRGRLGALAFCWAHMRRGFYDFYVSTKSPLAA